MLGVGLRLLTRKQERELQGRAWCRAEGRGPARAQVATLLITNLTHTHSFTHPRGSWQPKPLNWGNRAPCPMEETGLCLFHRPPSPHHLTWGIGSLCVA